MTGKFCFGCHLSLPKESFSKNKRKKDGLDSYCKKCTSLRSAANFQKNKTKRRERAIAWLAEHPGKAAAYSLKWRKNNPEKSTASDRKWYLSNREESLAADKLRRENNLEEFLLRERESYVRNRDKRLKRHKVWSARNRDKICFYSSVRRASLLRRTPPWLSACQISDMLAIYEAAKMASTVAGVKFHVDHIVPLRGKTVCGLHVPWNLQLLTQTENSKKSNRYET